LEELLLSDFKASDEGLKHLAKGAVKAYPELFMA